MTARMEVQIEARTLREFTQEATALGDAFFETTPYSITDVRFTAPARSRRVQGEDSPDARRVPYSIRATLIEVTGS